MQDQLTPAEREEQMVQLEEELLARLRNGDAGPVEFDDEPPLDEVQPAEANRLLRAQLRGAFATRRITRTRRAKAIRRPIAAPRPRGAGRPARRSACRSSARSGDSGDDDGPGEPPRVDDGWNGRPPLWQGRGPELVCDTCGWRYWVYGPIKPGSRCPARIDAHTRCDGAMGWSR